jgi:hypothetical protein
VKYRLIFRGLEDFCFLKRKNKDEMERNQVNGEAV